jgi:hypothetical protein
MKNLIVLIFLVSFNLSIFAIQPSLRSVKLKAAALNKARSTPAAQATTVKRNL